MILISDLDWRAVGPSKKQASHLRQLKVSGCCTTRTLRFCMKPTLKRQYTITIQPQPDGGQKLLISGRLELFDLAIFSREIQPLLQQPQLSSVGLDLGGLEYLDSAGALAVLQLAEKLKSQGIICTLDNISPKIKKILDLIDIQALTHPPLITVGKRFGWISQVGEASLAFWRDIIEVIAFFGELLLDLASVCLRPRRVRWEYVMFYMKRAGVDGLPIVSLIGLLLGLIIAFMSSLQLQQFGANIYVASLLGVAMVRELGPIMTAILVAGRSGSAFAAEIGSMKVSEEVDALTVMGFNPMRMLTTPKVIASLVVVPLLTIYADLLGIIGGLIVGVTMLDLTVYSYIQETRRILTLFDFTSSFIKSVVFAFLISAIGCQRGFQVRGGASAVGSATTSAVVAAIFLIIVVDSIFAIVLTYV